METEEKVNRMNRQNKRRRIGRNGGREKGGGQVEGEE